MPDFIGLISFQKSGKEVDCCLFVWLNLYFNKILHCITLNEYVVQRNDVVVNNAEIHYLFNKKGHLLSEISHYLIPSRSDFSGTSLSLPTSPPYHRQWPVSGLHFLSLIWEKDWESSCCVILRNSKWWPACKYWDSNPSFSVELVNSYRWVFMNLLASFSTFPS